MRTWNSQRYFAEGLAAGVDESILNNAIATAEHTLRQPSPGPPILTLGHLGHLTGVDVGKAGAAHFSCQCGQINRLPLAGVVFGIAAMQQQ